MPTTVRIAPGRLVSVLRRREGDRCWIDAYASEDDGANWSFRGKVGDAAGDPLPKLRTEATTPAPRAPFSQLSAGCRRTS